MGSSGRIGSYIMRQAEEQNRKLKPLTRTNIHEIGSKYTAKGSPIFICTPGNAVPDILKHIPVDRIPDLCLICNGIFSDFFPEKMKHYYRRGVVTCCVPHFGVLSVGADAICGPGCPPTVIYGYHSDIIRTLLDLPVPVEVVDSIMEVDTAAVKKLLWASILWLFTSDPDNECPTVKHVHDNLSDQVSALVEELLPAAEALVLGCCNDDDDPAKERRKQQLGSSKEVVKYLEAYSYSMHDATPSLQLALGEVHERNMKFLNVVDGPPGVQLLHRQMLKRVGVDTNALIFPNR